jgi:hypothetical protein
MGEVDWCNTGWWRSRSRVIATPVEKAVAGPTRVVAAPVEKAVGELQKAAVGQRRGGEGGRGQPGSAMKRDQGGRPRSGTVEMLAVGPPTVEAA